MQDASAYYPVEPPGMGVEEYFGFLRRRGTQIAAVSALLTTITVVVAFVWPATYRSTATILIQEQEIPADLVRSTVTSYADERIQVISQQVMTRSVLLGLVEKHNLYANERKTETNDEILDRMRKAIKLAPVTADVTDRRSGSRMVATIAFTLAFEDVSATAAQRVANDLVSLYLNENLKNRQRQAAETSSFLAEEADRLAKQISAIQEKLAAFKTQYKGRTPELAQLNLQLSDRTDSELMRIDRDITNLEDRRIYLEAQLALARPNAPLGTAAAPVLEPEDRLKALEAQEASLSGIYSDDHPDLQRVRREIAGLRRKTGAPAGGEDRTKLLAEQQAKLAALRDRYGEDHPDIQRLKRSIAALEAGGKSEAASEPAKARKPDNPLYVSLQTQLESTNNDLRTQRALREELRSRLRSYESRLEQTPEIERSYLELIRDYENSVARYRELKTKQLQAQVAEELERDRKAERFTLIDPPERPEKPARPNRLAILLIGFALSLGGGVGVAAVREALTGAVHGAAALGRATPVPIIAAIPYVEDASERSRRRRLITLASIGLAVTAVTAVVLAHFFYRPLPVLWYALVRMLGI
jgi:uncharacterized protein involved in exopolysaccharide biosynthesis